MNNFYVVCDGIRSLQNIGSIFRTSDALGVNKIFLTGICGCPPHGKISKTALGAEETVPWEYHYHCWRVIDKLKKEGVFVVALERNRKSVSYEKVDLKYPLALVLGHEIKGVSRGVMERADCVVHLPMLGKKRSLNVSVAFGAVGYFINRQRYE